MTALRIDIYEKQRLAHTLEASNPVELGRQTEGEPAPYSDKLDNGRYRLVFAQRDEKEVSRRHVAVEPLTAGRARLINLSKTTPLHILDAPALEPGGKRDISVPAFLVFGDKKICIQQSGAEPLPPPQAAAEPAAKARAASEPGSPLLSLAEVISPPGGTILARGRMAGASMIAPSEMDPDAMIRWLHAAMDVLHSAAGSDDFFDKAATALVDMVGLDAGQVLLLDKGNWKMQAQHLSPRSGRDYEPQPSRFVLDKVLEEKKTFWQVPPAKSSRSSLMGICALVASPILDRDGNVIGALYGDRQAHGLSAGLPSITKLEAMLVELLASGIAAGLARLEQEQANLQRQKKFLQYERELDIGRQIQVGFLPETLPQPPGWEIGARFQPAREVAGDFYDVFALTDTHLGLVMADVCDKGVGAALFMALFRSLIRAYSYQTFIQLLDLPTDPRVHAVTSPGRRLEGVLTELNVLSTVIRTNRYVATNHAKACMFVTLFMGILDTGTGTLTYVNGGHDAPAIIGPKGIKTRLQPTGPVVGLMPDSTYEARSVVLERGDTLFTFTDGVGDARDPAGKSFTEKHLLALLEQPAPTAAAMLDRIEASLREHIGKADQFDDITMMAVRSSK